MSVQLRLGFDRAQTPLRIQLTLAGLVVLADSADADDDRVLEELRGVGIACSADDVGVRFEVTALADLIKTPDHVTFSADDALEPLLLLTVHPSDHGRPADLKLSPTGTLHLSWLADGVDRFHELKPAAATALLCAELPFVASAEAFDMLGKVCHLPLLAGRAHVNLDGFVEIVSSKPQLVESAPLPGLFRLDSTRLGLALPYAGLLDTLPGFKWTTTRPIADDVPDVTVAGAVPMPLSTHAAAALQPLVTGLSTWRAQAVVWPSGLGRRVFAIAALAALDAWPTLIVCRPEDVWPWMRHTALAGRIARVTDINADVHIVTYDQLAATGGWPRSVQAIIFDNPHEAVKVPAVAAAASRLASLADAYRLLVADHWPQDQKTALQMLHLLRPAEFDPDIAVPVRYPPDSNVRFAAHANAYISQPPDTAGRPRGFRRSRVIALPPIPAQIEAWDKIRARTGSAPAVTLTNLMDVTSAGPDYAAGPKIAVAVSAANESLDAGRRVTLVTRHSRTAQLLAGLLRTRNPQIVTDAASLFVASKAGRLVVAKFDREWPDLSHTDHVVVIDWPWAIKTLDDAVGSPASPDGPDLVEVMHICGSVDDRLVLAAGRRTGPDSATVAGPPSAAEVAWLLSTGGV